MSQIIIVPFKKQRQLLRFGYQLCQSQQVMLSKFPLTLFIYIDSSD